MAVSQSPVRPRARASAPHMQSPGVAERNSFLNSLSAHSYAKLLFHLQHRLVRVHEVLWEPNETIANVYFPRSCVGSILIPLECDSLRIEAGTVGKEGFLGSPVVLGVDSSASRAIVQVEGDCAVVTADAFRELLADDATLLARSLKFVHVLQEQTAQSVACNRRHHIEQRCARWLLMTHDGIGRDQFTLLQTFLASMLGVHRPRVTVAAGALQDAGLISYQRGVVSIRDRAGLERAACECYALVRTALERTMA